MKKKKGHKKSNSIKIGKISKLGFSHKSPNAYAIKKNYQSNFFNNNKKKIKSQKGKSKLNKSLQVDREPRSSKHISTSSEQQKENKAIL